MQKYNPSLDRWEENGSYLIPMLVILLVGWAVLCKKIIKFVNWRVEDEKHNHN